jgi:hypothetical protein
MTSASSASVNSAPLPRIVLKSVIPAILRKINLAGAVVRLSGFRTKHHDTVDLVGARYDIHTLLTTHCDPSPSGPASADSPVATIPEKPR